MHSSVVYESRARTVLHQWHEMDQHRGWGPTSHSPLVRSPGISVVILKFSACCLAPPTWHWHKPSPCFATLLCPCKWKNKEQKIPGMNQVLGCGHLLAGMVPYLTSPLDLPASPPCPAPCWGCPSWYQLHPSPDSEPWGRRGGKKGNMDILPLVLLFWTYRTFFWWDSSEMDLIRTPTIGWLQQ